MFFFFVIAIQQKLLSVCAERSEDTMEHCRLVLLLLNRFPQSSTELAVRISLKYVLCKYIHVLNILIVLAKTNGHNDYSGKTQPMP